MLFTGALALSLGAAIAKAMLKTWLGDGVHVAALGAGIDAARGQIEKALGNVPDQRRIEQVGAQVAARLWPIFQQEAAGLARDDRDVVAVEVAATLAHTPIDADLLVACRLDPQRLAERLAAQRPDAARDLSADQAALYQRTLAEVSREIMVIATELAGFAGTLAAVQLQTDGQVLEYLANLLAQPAQADAAFEQIYRDAVRRVLDRMELFGIRRMDRTTGRQSLSIAYITLEATGRPDQPTAEKYTQADASHLLDQLLRDDPRSPLSSAAVPASQSGPVDHLLALARQIVVRGDAGSGKTTLLQWVAVRAAARHFPPILAAWNNTVPFFIRLRQRVGQGFPRPEELPGLVDANIAGEMPPGWVHRQLRSGRAVVLVDGLDELPDDQRQPMLAQFDHFVQDYPLARYIITSRSSALKVERWPEWPEWCKRSGFLETVLRSMSQPTIEQFVHQWYIAFVSTLTDARERAELADAPKQLIHILAKRPDLRQTASSPLLCAMICALHQERRQSLPAERIKLYQECIEMLLGRRDEGRKIALGTTYPNLSDSQKLALIQKFAYSMLQNGETEVTRAWADAHFAERIAHMRVPEDATGPRVCDFFIERAALLREPVAGYVDFAHRTFQEFLAAQAAARNHDIGVLKKNAHDDLWRETVILAAGLLSQTECEDLLRYLSAPKSAAQRAGKLPSTPTAAARRYQSVALAVACLETAVELSSQLRDQVVQQAALLFPPKDGDEARLLAAGGNAVVPLLYYKNEYSKEQSIACIQALAIIGTPAALDAIASYASNEHAEVSQMLISAWNNFDRRVYAAQVLRHRNTLRIGKFTSWEGFNQLTNLTSLSLNRTTVENISPLAQLTSLTKLSLSFTRVQDIAPLIHLRALTWLGLNGTEVQDISPLAQLRALTWLGLNGTKVRDLRPLAQIPSLTTLDLSGTEVRDIHPLAQLRNLTTLALNDTEVRDLRPLAQLPSLTTLDLGYTQVQDLQPLAQLSSLTTLDLSRTRVQNIQPLAQLPSLTTLNLSYTQVQDLRPLVQLPSLTKLYLSGTEVQDISPLARINGLIVYDSNHTPLSYGVQLGGGSLL